MVNIIVPLNQGDNAVPVIFYLSDQNSNPIDLSNTSSNTFQMYAPNSLVTVTNSSASLASAQGGAIQYLFVAADTQNAGNYNGQFTLNYVAGNASGRVIIAGGLPNNQIQINIAGEPVI